MSVPSRPVSPYKHQVGTTSEIVRKRVARRDSGCVILQGKKLPYPDLTPMRWPSGWQDLAYLALLADTGINCLLVEKNPALDKVVALARQQGIVVLDSASPPPGVTIVSGEWPGLKTTRGASRHVYNWRDRQSGSIPSAGESAWRPPLCARRSPLVTPSPKPRGFPPAPTC